jgi:hypothetical protein
VQVFSYLYFLIRATFRALNRAFRAMFRAFFSAKNVRGRRGAGQQSLDVFDVVTQAVGSAERVDERRLGLC